MLNRSGIVDRLRKICFVCNRGFCQRKGRAKACVVAGHPGRYVCRCCAGTIKLVNGNGRGGGLNLKTGPPPRPVALLRIQRREFQGGVLFSEWLIRSTNLRLRRFFYEIIKR